MGFCPESGINRRRLWKVAWIWTGVVSFESSSLGELICKFAGGLDVNCRRSSIAKSSFVAGLAKSQLIGSGMCPMGSRREPNTFLEFSQAGASN